MRTNWPVGDSPTAIAFNPVDRSVYVVNTGSNSVSAISDSSFAPFGSPNGVVSVGESPNAIAQGVNGFMFVTNQGSDTVSVISAFIPVSNAGHDQTAGSGDTVHLDGSGSRDDSGGGAVTSYKWTQTSGPEVTLSDSTAEKPTFIASLSGSQQDIVFELVVTNPRGLESEPDNVTITVNPVSLPTATTIATAKDGNGNAVENKGSTVSTSITFQVTSTKGTNNIAGFECSLDDSAFSNCSTSNPATIKYDNLASDKKHTFQERAVDTQGNTDPNPAGFEWTI